MIPGRAIEISQARERWMDALCGPRVRSEDRIQHVLQSELLGPARREEGSSDSGEKFSLQPEMGSEMGPTGCSFSFGHTLQI